MANADVGEHTVALAAPNSLDAIGARSANLQQKISELVSKKRTGMF